MTQHKCDGCFYKTNWKDETHEFPICERIWWGSFERCKEECEKLEPCPHYITHEEVEQLIYDNEAKFEDLLGKTIIEIDGAEEDNDVIVLLCDDGTKYMMYHEQDCCESVRINDICGDVTRLIGSPITKAECTSNSDDSKINDYDDSWTWTFYHLATVKGYVTIRWYGTSNGY